MKIAFTGDICFTGFFSDKLGKDQEIFSTELIFLLKEMDFVVGNLEGAATSSTHAIKQPALKNPEIALKYLAEKNVKIADLANNHFFDFGIQGLEDTLRLSSVNGSRVFGAGHNIKEASNPLFIEKDGITIALIGCTHNEGMMATRTDPGVFGDGDMQYIKRTIRIAKENADHVIMIYHGGEEYTLFPMPQRRKLFKKFAEFGASAVVGHHSHVVQGVELHKSIPLFYSLGNFVFDYPEHSKMGYTNKSALLCMEIHKGKSIEYKLVPLEISLSEEIIKLSEEGFPPHINDFSNYKKNWNKEAHRVWKQKRQSKQPASDPEIQKTSPFNVFKRVLNFMKKLRYPSYRSVILGAMVHSLKNRFND